MDREDLNRRMSGRDRNHPRHKPRSLNYNERADGYGFGPSESVDDDQPYEQERSMYRHNQSRDENGQPNQYGEVDQYSFRDVPLRSRDSRPRYQNDDHSRYAGPNYRENEFETERGGNYGTNPFDYRESGTPRRPGVSGKRATGERWTNEQELRKQRNFIGKGPKGYQRTDDRIYDEVCSALMDCPDIDASEIGVKVENGIVVLEGKVDSRHEKRLSETIIEDLPGVRDIRNELKLSGQENRQSSDEQRNRFRA